MAPVMFLAFELKQIKLKEREITKLFESPLFLRRGPHFGEFQPAAKIAGSPIDRTRLLTKTLRLDFGRLTEDEIVLNLEELGVTEFLIHFSKRHNPVVCLRLRLDGNHYAKASSYRRLSSKKLNEILGVVGLAEALDASQALYPVVGTLTDFGDEWTPMTKDGWIHTQGDYLDEQILQQLVTQVAIERSICNWALSPRSRLTRVFAPAVISFFIRKWPVEFVAHKEEVLRDYQSLRESLNLPGIRGELIEAGRHWWSVVGIWAAFVTVVIAIIGIYL